VSPRRGQEKTPAEEKQTQLYPARRALGTPRGGDAPLITYRSNTDASPEAERTARAVVLRYILDCHTKRKAGVGNAGSDANKGGL
jgi:hypothetical protein